MGAKLNQIKLKIAELVKVPGMFPEAIEFAKEPLWYQIAMKELGQEEVPGHLNNPRVLEYHQETKLKATEDSVPWCSSFVCWCLHQAGYESTRNAWARSYQSFGESLLFPKVGAIMLFKRGANAGHVGFLHSEVEGSMKQKMYKIIGGNQGNRVSIAPFPKSDLITMRWPVKKLANFSKVGF